MKKETGLDQDSISLNLLNLNCFGLGYFIAGLMKRGLIALAGNLALLIIAHVVNASKQPVLWAVIFLAVFIAMAVDLWLLIRKDPGLIPEKLTEKKYYMLAICILVNLIFFGGFIAYRIGGNKVIEKGVQAYEQGDYQASFKYLYSATRLYRLSLNPQVVAVEGQLGEVGTIVSAQNYTAQARYEDAVASTKKFHDFFPDSSKGSFMNELAIENSLALVKELQTNHDYQASQEAFETMLADYPDEMAQRSVEIDEAMAENYLMWGAYLSEAADFETAIDKYEMVLASYPTSDSLEDAYQGAAQAHYDLALDLKTRNRYSDAYDQLIEVEQAYGKADILQKAKNEMPDTLLKFGFALRDEGHFLNAMEKFQEISTYTSKESYLTRADTAIEDTITKLAKDEGEDGISVYTEAKTQACEGTPVDHAAVDIFTEEQGTILSCESRYRSLVPEDLKATQPGTFRYVVQVEDADRRVQSCDYLTSSDTRTLERWQYGLKVTIRSVKTGEIFKQKTFVGTSPESCPREYWFSRLTELTWGEDVDWEKITSWLETVLK